MHRSRFAGISIDCPMETAQAAPFWSQALGMAAPPSGEGTFVPLDAQGRDLRVEVQAVEHAARVHLDIETDDVAAEVARLEALGARRIEARNSWWIMEAPTGQRFCVVPCRGPGFAEGRGVNVWP
jgi:hypothetical protein